MTFTPAFLEKSFQNPVVFVSPYVEETVCRILTTILTYCIPLEVEVACKLQYIAEDVGLATAVLVS
jgi:hypothetical protein